MSRVTETGMAGAAGPAGKFGCFESGSSPGDRAGVLLVIDTKQ